MTVINFPGIDIRSIIPVRGPLLPWGPITNRLVYPEQDQSDGTSQNSTYRSRHVFQEDTPFIVVGWCNRSGPNGNPTTAVTYKASFDYVPAGTGSLNSIPVVPMTLSGGQQSVTAQPGGWVFSDPIFGPFKAGDAILIRTNVQVASAGQKWPIGMTLNWGFEGIGTGDQTSAQNFAFSFTSTGPGVSPALICGPGASRMSAAGIGDSIFDGAGDSASGPFNNVGPFARALDGYMGYLRTAEPGERLASVVASAGYVSRGLLPLQAGNIVSNYGTNDIGNGDALATIQANLITLWKMYAAFRPVFQGTILPRTTSTDSFATVANQTVRSGESVRTTLNTWLRAGAPVNGSLVAVAVGTPGALLAGSSGHPLTGLFDLAATVEVNSSGVLTLNGGFWPASGTADGIHPTAATSATISTAIDRTKFKPLL